MAVSTEITVAMFVYIAAGVLLTFLLVSIMNNLCTSKSDGNETKIESIFTNSSLICILLFWIRSFVAGIYYIEITEGADLNKLSYLLDIGWICYGVAIWLLLLAFISRIDYTFKNRGNKHQYSSFIIKLEYILLIIILFLILSTGIMNALRIEEAVYIGYGVLITHFIFSIILSFLLLNKIYFLMKSRLNQQTQINVSDISDISDISDNSDIGNESINNDRINVIKLNDVKSVTRFGLLIFIGIISTYTASILIFLDVEFSWSNHEDLLPVSSIFLGIDIIINSICIYLLYKFNNTKYSMLCSECDDCFEKWCIECVYRAGNSQKITKEECENLILTKNNYYENDALL